MTTTNPANYITHGGWMSGDFLVIRLDAETTNGRVQIVSERTPRDNGGWSRTRYQVRSRDGVAVYRTFRDAKTAAGIC